MKLIVFELSNSITQTVTPDENVMVEAIRPHLYKHNNPAGTFSLQIRDTNDQLIAVSANSLSASDISSSAFFHGFVRFYIKCNLRKNTTYKVVLVSSGYTFQESAYIGWCSGFDFLTYPPDYTPSAVEYSPLDLEIWKLA